MKGEGGSFPQVFHRFSTGFPQVFHRLLTLFTLPPLFFSFLWVFHPHQPPFFFLFRRSLQPLPHPPQPFFLLPFSFFWSVAVVVSVWGRTAPLKKVRVCPPLPFFKGGFTPSLLSGVARPVLFWSGNLGLVWWLGCGGVVGAGGWLRVGGVVGSVFQKRFA